MIKYREQIATRQLLQSVNITETSEEGDDQVVIHLTPEEKVRKLLVQLILDSKPLASEEKKYLYESIKLVEVRGVAAELFLSFMTPRKIQDKDCFQTLGQLCCRWLDVLLNEQSGTLKDLNAVLQISQMLFHFEGIRKVILSNEIVSHKIWENSETWKVCLQRMINQKFHDAVKQLEREKEQQEQEKKTSFFSGLIKTLS